MIVVMKGSATEGQIAAIVDRLSGMGARIQRLDGDTVTLATTGDAMDTGIESMAGVAAMLADAGGTPLVTPAASATANRACSAMDSMAVLRPDATTGEAGRGVQVGDRRIGGEELFLAAGPCSVEDPATMDRIAAAVAAAGAMALRAGAYKPRTSPYSFQGVGEEGLAVARAASDAHGLLLVSEVIDATQIPVAALYVDILQVGARNMANTSLLRELGRARRPVLLKRGFAATIDEWLGAAEYIMAGGNPSVILCERGIRTFETATRNTLDLNAVPVVRQRTHLPILVDPSHGTGYRDYVPAMARAAIAAGADGLLLEVHTEPDSAVSDAAQTITPETFRRITDDARAIRSALAAPGLALR